MICPHCGNEIAQPAIHMPLVNNGCNPTIPLTLEVNSVSPGPTVLNVCVAANVNATAGYNPYPIFTTIKI